MHEADQPPSQDEPPDEQRRSDVGDRTLIRRRPRILVSSSITGMEDIREAIRAAVEALDIADAWLFEFSFVAAGSPASSQYLQVARDCDLCVLLVAEPPRQGTIDEYEVARDDNPAKILAFVVGPDSSPADPFRRSLRQHAVKRVDTLEDLPSAVAKAVEAHLVTGETVRAGLTSRLRERALTQRALVGLPPGFAFHRMLDDGTESRATSELLRTPHVVMAGPAGSGKTDAALNELLRAASGGGPLPLYLLAAPGKGSLVALIESAFDSVRFTPGRALIEQYQRDGRLILVVDGLDELGPDDRDALLADIEQNATEFPRTAVVVLLRFPQAGRLTPFVRWRLTDLGPSDLEMLLAAYGVTDSPVTGLDSRLLDLVKRPFWAALVARYGRAVRTGPELLEHLVADRIDTGLVADGLTRARARAAAEHLALSIRPAAVVSLDEALRSLADWSGQPDVAAMHAVLPASTQLDQLRQTGILGLDNGSVVFAHPLLAAYLAACRASKLGSLPAHATDPDFWPLLGAQLAEPMPGLLVELLAANDIFTIAAVARLVEDTPRIQDEATDLDRLDRAIGRFGHLGGNAGFGSPLAFFSAAGYLSVRQLTRGEPRTQRDGDFASWVRASGLSPSRAVCWRGDPLARTTPEILAARIVVLSFKESAQRLRPRASPFGPHEWDLKALTRDRESLALLALRHVHAKADARRAVCAALELTATELDARKGLPHLSVRIGAKDARFSVSWGNHDEHVDIRDEEPEWTGDSVRELLADPAAVDFADLVREIEDRLGSALRTQAARRPSTFDWTL